MKQFIIKFSIVVISIVALLGAVQPQYIESLIAQSVQFVVNGSTSLSPGEMAWDPDEHTLSVGSDVAGSSFQLAMENVRYVHNETGTLINDGDVVVFGAVAADGHITVTLANTATLGDVDGVATSDIPNDGHGLVTIGGTLHDTDITGLSLNDVVYSNPAVLGGKINALPVYPDWVVKLGKVTKDNGDNTGDIHVSLQNVQREVPTPVVLPYSSPSPARNAEENIHGGLIHLSAAHNLNAGPLTLSAASGIGKILIVVNSASPDCTITVNGTTVNRDTGVETANQDSVITVDTITTDTSANDVNGYEWHDFQTAYISDKWFTGIPIGVAEDIIITGTGTTVPTDIDVYHISFEQFNDATYIGLVTADMNYKVVTPDKMSAYIYTVEVTGDKVSLTKQGEHVRTALQHVAGQMYRIRRGNMGIELDGTTDGIYLTITMNGNSQFADVGIKVWGQVLY